MCLDPLKQPTRSFLDTNSRSGACNGHVLQSQVWGVLGQNSCCKPAQFQVLDGNVAVRSDMKPNPLASSREGRTVTVKNRAVPHNFHGFGQRVGLLLELND